MKKVLLSLAAAGLLFSTSAFSQNTDTKTPSTNVPAATTTAPATTAPATTAKPSGQNQAAPSGQRRELSGPNDRTERNGDALSVAGIGPNVAVSVVIAIIGAGPAITTGIGAGNHVRAEKAALIGRFF